MQLSRVNIQAMSNPNRQGIDNRQKSNFQPSFGKLTPKMDYYFYHYRNTFAKFPKFNEIKSALINSPLVVGIQSPNKHVVSCGDSYNFVVMHPEGKSIWRRIYEHEIHDDDLHINDDDTLRMPQKVMQYLERVADLLTKDPVNHPRGEIDGWLKGTKEDYDEYAAKF